MISNLSEHQIEQLGKFKDYTVEKLLRNDLGTVGFSELKDRLNLLKSMLNESLAILEANDDIPNTYKEVLFSYIQTYNDNGNNLMSYNPEKINSSQQKQSFINSVNSFYNLMLTGTDANGQMLFINLYTYLKQKQLDNGNKSLSDLEDKKIEFIDLNKQVNELLNSLQERAKVVSLHDYSQVFLKQSQSHSNWIWNRLGGAQIWLCFTLVLIIAFGAFIYNINSIYPIKTNVSATIITIEYLTRILVVSFIIYLITFSAKQFNIQQHLAVVNKHRENTLNSYKLFIDSLGDSNSEVKDALMMEVAKAIYDSGQTGYLGNNDKSDSNPSLIEMTKYVGSK